MNALLVLTTPLRRKIFIFTVLIAYNCFASLALAVTPVIPPIPTALLSVTVPLDEMFGTWLRPYLGKDSHRLVYAGQSNANVENIVKGVSKFCESHGGITSKSGENTHRITVKCENATSLFKSFRLIIFVYKIINTYTSVDIFDENNRSFHHKELVSRFEGANRLLVASVLKDDFDGVSKAIADGADAKMMICDTSEEMLAPAGSPECRPNGNVGPSHFRGVRSLLALQLSEHRKTYTPIANALVSAGAKWPTDISQKLTSRAVFGSGFSHSSAATEAQRQAARIEFANGLHDLVKLGLVFNFADLKLFVEKTLTEDAFDRDFQLKISGIFAVATNQKKQFDQLVAEFEGMDEASLLRKANREIGDSVCKYERGEISGVKGIVKTMAFVEDKTPKKLKLRIAGFSMGKWTGMNYYASNKTNLSTNIMSKVNSIIFDDPINWRDDCGKITR